MNYLSGCWARFKQASNALLVAEDDTLQAQGKFWFWVFFARARPSSHETISATLGWGAAHGIKWCKVAAWLVDRVFGQGHCYSAYIKETPDEFPI